MSDRKAGRKRPLKKPVSLQCGLSYGVRTTPVCNPMHQHLLRCSYNPRVQSNASTSITVFVQPPCAIECINIYYGVRTTPVCNRMHQHLLRCSYNPRVQSNASTSIRKLKIPSTGSRDSTDFYDARKYCLQIAICSVRLL